MRRRSDDLQGARSTAMPLRSWRSRRSCRRQRPVRLGGSARSRPTKSGGCARSSSRASGSSRRAAASIRTRTCWRTCSATSGSTTPASAGSSQRTTRRSAAAKAGSWFSPTPAGSASYSQCRTPADRRRALELTIDQYLQYIAERELRAGVEENRAAGGSASSWIRDTGEILALANYPTFNPNAFARAADDDARNRGDPGSLRAGSTFKIVTASAALEESVITPDDLIDVSAGLRSRSAAASIDDTHRYGTLSFTDVIVKSSNVGAIKVGIAARPRAARPLRQPLRVRPGAGPRLPRRERRHRVESGEARRRARSPRCRWATRSA